MTDLSEMGPLAALDEVTRRIRADREELRRLRVDAEKVVRQSRQLMPRQSALRSSIASPSRMARDTAAIVLQRANGNPIPIFIDPEIAAQASPEVLEVVAGWCAPPEPAEELLVGDFTSDIQEALDAEERRQRREHFDRVAKFFTR